ncbi:MAG: beta-N-acetylhexosaminidase [Hyphomicrobiaceae bacterium]
MQAALIAGLSSTSLTDEERAFYRDVRPAGLILFSRNCHDLEQIKTLIAQTRDAVGAEDFLVLIDQEGGRVQRLRGALGRALPPARRYGDMYARVGMHAIHAARVVARLMAEDLRALGINTNCTPVLDVPVPGAHDIIGDRAFGTDPFTIIALAHEVIAGHIAGGVVPVIKHIPGHGRARSDSHLALPVVETPHAQLSASDFVPFHALRDAPAAMTAHVVFSAIDDSAPATTSRRVTQDIIRGEIGFDGLLMSDDLSMHALSGPMRTRAESVIAAGCDVALHCNGDMSEMRAAAEGVPTLSGPAQERFARACAITRTVQSFDRAEALAMLEEVLREGTLSAQSPESV